MALLCKMEIPHLLPTTNLCCGDQMKSQMESHLDYQYRLWILALSLTKSETWVCHFILLSLSLLIYKTR